MAHFNMGNLYGYVTPPEEYVNAADRRNNKLYNELAHKRRVENPIFFQKRVNGEFIRAMELRLTVCRRKEKTIDISYDQSAINNDSSVIPPDNDKRNYRFDTVVIATEDQDIISNFIEDLGEGKIKVLLKPFDFLSVRGSVCTYHDKREYICPKCHRVITKDKGVRYSVNPVQITRERGVEFTENDEKTAKEKASNVLSAEGRNNQQKDYEERLHHVYIEEKWKIQSDRCQRALMKNHSKTGNLFLLLGYVSKDPITYINPNDDENNKAADNCKICLSVERQVRIESQPDIRTDYPYLVAYNEETKKCSNYIKGMQIFSTGALQSRKHKQNVYCPVCGEVEVDSTDYEVYAYDTRVVKIPRNLISPIPLPEIGTNVTHVFGYVVPPTADMPENPALIRNGSIRLMRIVIQTCRRVFVSTDVTAKTNAYFEKCTIVTSNEDIINHFFEKKEDYLISTLKPFDFITALGCTHSRPKVISMLCPLCKKEELTIDNGTFLFVEPDFLVFEEHTIIKDQERAVIEKNVKDKLRKECIYENEPEYWEEHEKIYKEKYREMKMKKAGVTLRHHSEISNQVIIAGVIDGMLSEFRGIDEKNSNRSIMRCGFYLKVPRFGKKGYQDKKYDRFFISAYGKDVKQHMECLDNGSKVLISGSIQYRDHGVEAYCPDCKKVRVITRDTEIFAANIEYIEPARYPENYREDLWE